MFKSKKWALLAALVFGLFAINACKGDEDQKDAEIPVPKPVPAQITAPMNGDTFFIGDEIELQIAVNRAEEVNDLTIKIADTIFKSNLNPETQTLVIPTIHNQVGPFKLTISYTDEKGKLRADNREILLFSDIDPDFKIAEIVQRYPHAKTSYTQGLEFYNGKLYEGTGQYNQSILAEVDLTTGKSIRQHNLDGSVFGEGITILNDTIYQITYRSQICYVYDMDFNLLTTFTYDGEGWGLCNNGTHLIMSNGEDKVVWRDPKDFKIVKTLPVFDNKKSIVNINELELIGGDLYANIYTENQLIQIDTTTGKVLSYIDCNRVRNDVEELGIDVLNGIAHNPATNKTYVTGKWWPTLYEVVFE